MKLENAATYETLVNGKPCMTVKPNVSHRKKIYVREMLTRLEDAGVILNEKHEFSKIKIKLLGYIISEKGILAYFHLFLN